MTSLQALLDATQPKGRRYYWKSEYLPRIEEALCEKLITHAEKIQSPHSALILFQIEGALNQRETGYSPAGNRDARYVLNMTASWEQPVDDTKNIEWARATWNGTKQFSTGGNYINFLTQDESPDRVEAALSGALRRLGEVKTKRDPENVFRTNRNIKPG